MSQTHYIRYNPGDRSLRFISKLHTGLFQLTSGRIGARLDGLDILLLHSVGRRSQISRWTPMPFFETRDGYLLMASNGGRHQHPGWYHNLRASKVAEVQLSASKTEVDVVELQGTEYEAAYEKIVSLQPRYRQYVELAQRRIPIIKLVPKREVRNIR